MNLRCCHLIQLVFGTWIQLAWLQPAAAYPVLHTDSSTNRCAIYRAAMGVVAGSDSVVVVDSTVMAVPSFAFYALTTYSRDERAHQLQVSDSQVHALESLNEQREAISDCITNGPIQPVTSASLFALFKDRKDGWARFHQHYLGARRFILVSRPLQLDSSSVLIYVAQASDWLNGEGQILLIQRDPAGQWYVKGKTTLWVS